MLVIFVGLSLVRICQVQLVVSSCKAVYSCVHRRTVHLYKLRTVVHIQYNICTWFYRLYELCTQKYSSSVQVVYSSKVYLYINIYIYKVQCPCVCVWVPVIWVVYTEVQFICTQIIYIKCYVSVCVLFIWVFFWKMTRVKKNPSTIIQS